MRPDGLPRTASRSPIRQHRRQAPAGHHRSTPQEKAAASPSRIHGRHVLNRYEDGMEKCIGCELCAGVCPARCIYVRGADNPPDDPVSPGERFGFVYEINYLRCIHCDLCVEACPTEAITESKLFEFSFTNRAGRHLHQGRAGRRRRRPAPAAALGGLARRRGRAHLGLDAGHRAVGQRRLRGPGRLVGRARLRRARPRAGPGPRGPAADPDRRRRSTMAARRTTTTPETGGTDALMEARRLHRRRGHRPRAAALGVVLSRNPVHSRPQPGRHPVRRRRAVRRPRTPTSWPPCRSSSTPAPSSCSSCS